jgi:hypothetical protein
MPDEQRPISDLPIETFTAARRIFNIQNIYLRIGDHLESILAPLSLARLDPSSSLDNESIARRALVSSFQIVEALPDAYAADATLNRMDWKYALHLPLYHPGIQAAALCGFRQNLYISPAGLKEFGCLLRCLGEFGLFSQYSLQALNPLERLMDICNINRLTQLRKAMEAALAMITAEAPTWLRSIMRSHWYNHYHARRFSPFLEQVSLDPFAEALTLGKDMRWLLDRMESMESPMLSGRAEIKELARLWDEQFEQPEGIILWRQPGCASCMRRHL